jgi:peroxiredoxin
MVFDGRALWLGVTLPGLALFVLRPVARRRHRARTVRRFPATAKRRREPRTGPTATPALPLGATVPRFSLPALSGGEVALDALLEAGRPVLLVFVTPGCRRCRGLARNLAAWQRRHHADATIGVISRGDVRAHTWFAAMGVTNILVQRGWEVATAYGVRRTPAAVLVAADGTVASGLVGDEGGMAELLAVASRHRSRSGVEYSGLGATTRGPTIVA